ncbi:hypothetical protein ACE1B6_20925 [Aerosakkonemataceae cyanobacterium BLCC-F154]|uniref:Uncharacterized protein n=1 Tax=Floridaenema fluviatile BLCC-F154 TaxID=3153640 RepID=A0ABV4YFX4_9CYAN
MTQSSNWLNSLVTNPWFVLAISIISVLGVIITVVNIKVKRPCYAIRSVGIIEDIASKSKLLEMYYAGHKIERLTVTRIAFWNAGNETIDRKDIAAADPIKIVLSSGYNILDVKLIYEKDKVNQFNFNFQSGNPDVILNFDYLDKHDGAIIQIVHTGEDSKNFEIYGRVKGVGKLRLVSNELFSKGQEISVAIFSAATAVISSVLGTIINSINNIGVLYTANVIYIIIIMTSVLIIIWELNKFFFKRIPKEFNIFKDEYWGL